MRRVEWRDQDTENCSIGRTLDVVGKPWVLQILREAFRGLQRFADIQQHLGISEPVLSRRLAGLVEAGLLEQRRYRQPGQRGRSEYHLTDGGRELFPLLAALKGWGDVHLADPEGPATVHLHRGCGRPVGVELRCAAGHRIRAVSEIVVQPGPAARPLVG